MELYAGISPLVSELQKDFFAVLRSEEMTPRKQKNIDEIGKKNTAR
jgi:hypothetical protein